MFEPAILNSRMPLGSEHINIYLTKPTPQDLEMTIFETSRHNWGFRNFAVPVHSLNYKTNV